MYDSIDAPGRSNFVRAVPVIVNREKSRSTPGQSSFASDDGFGVPRTHPELRSAARTVTRFASATSAERRLFCSGRNRPDACPNALTGSAKRSNNPMAAARRTVVLSALPAPQRMTQRRDARHSALSLS